MVTTISMMNLKRTTALRLRSGLTGSKDRVEKHAGKDKSKEKAGLLIRIPLLIVY